MNKLALAFAALAALATGAGCGKSPVEAAKEEPTGAVEEHKDDVALKPEALKAAGIRSAPVTERSIQARLEVPGSVSIPGDARAVVTPPVAGKVVRLYASVGDAVRRGQPLAEIQSGDLAEASSAIAAAQTQVGQAEATVRQQSSAVDLARGRLRTAQESLSRQRRFALAGAFSQPTLVAARNDLSEAQTEAASAQSDLAGAQSRLDRAERLGKEGLVSKADLDQARLDVKQAQIRVERSGQRTALAQQTLGRETRIGSQGLLNAREIQAAEAEARAAKLELDQAQVARQGAQGALLGARRAVQNARESAAAIRGGSGGSGSNVTLTAPIAGTITERKATLGQAVERASDLFDIENASTVWVTANVPEADVARVRSGATATVTTSAYPDRSFAGTVRLVGTRLDPKTRTLPVQCAVANPQGLLRADLFARVRLATGGSVSALAVPIDALVGEEDDRAVFVDEGGRYERRKVKTGRRDGRFVEVTEGLKAGERIAVTGVFTLLSESKKDELKGDDD